MRKILILYISNISGHRSAANAIEKAIKMLSPSCEVKGMNFFQYVAPITEKVVNTMYMGVIKRAPIIWQVMYDNPRVVRSTSRARKFVYMHIRNKVNKLITSFKPDVVIATQAFPCEIIARYKQEMNANFKLFAVLTDYAPHSFWISDAVDYYIVASEEVKERLEKKNVPSEKIEPLGIPIDPEFYFSKDPQEIRSRLSLPEDKDIVLIMGGGQGLGPLKKIVQEVDGINFDFAIVVVCGNNKRLYKSIDKLYPRLRHQLYNFGYITNVDEFMTVAKVLISKAGGLTVSEAMAKGLPIVVVNALPGQEYNNLKFILKNRCGLRAEDEKEARLHTEELLKDYDLWYKLHRNALLAGKPNSALELAHLSLEM